jgi:uncharacterized protein DUF4900
MSGHCQSLRHLGDRLRGARTGRRGAAFLFSLFVLMVVSIIGMGLAASTAQSLYLARIQEHSSMAFNAAESGVEHALLWLRQQSIPPPGGASFNPFGGSVTLGLANYQVTIDPDDGNAALDLKHYLIRSTGTALSRQETVEVHVQVNSFGRYAYFTDAETTPGGRRIWFKTGDVIRGPVHSNSTGGSDFQISWEGSTAPIFQGLVTTASSEIDYIPGVPATEEEFERIYQEGSRGYRLGVARIELPESSNQQQVAAWGDSSGFPTTNGVHINANGGTTAAGIYLAGDSSLYFSVTPEGWQQIEVTQGSTTTTITIKHDQNQTVVEQGDTTTTYTGTTNGVIYSTGNITSLSGELADSRVSGSGLVSRNAFTIATDVTKDKDVTITGNLTYRTVPDPTLPWDDPVNLRAPALGVVARNITIAPGAPRDLSVHGVMLAGGRNTTQGSFSAAEYNTRAAGRLNLVGGLIQKYRGPVGTFSGTTTVTGYDKNYVYDPRMAVMPPPFFPTTGGFERLSFMRTSAGPARR